MLKQYMLALVSFIATLILTLISDFLLNLPKETSYLIFAIGTMLTLTSTLLQKEIEGSFSKEARKSLKLYERLENINDTKLQEEVYELVEQISKGKIPPHITATRSRYLLENVKKIMKASYYAPDIERLYEWKDNPRQRTYFEGNISAVKMGIKIERNFLIKKEQFVKNNILDPKALSIFTEQSKAGIKVHILFLEDLIGRPPSGNIEQEFVIFDDQELLIIDRKYGNQLYRLPSERIREFEDRFIEQGKYTQTLDELLSKYSNDLANQKAG